MGAGRRERGWKILQYQIKGKEIFTGSKCYEREIERKRERERERER